MSRKDEDKDYELPVDEPFDFEEEVERLLDMKANQ